MMDAARIEERPSRTRFLVMAMIFVTVVINYLDRSNLSIAAPSFSKELHIDPVHLGIAFSAFGWTYAALQIPMGWLVDRIHPRVLYAAALAIWSAVTFCMGFASSFVALLLLRLLVGAFEAPSFPINNRVVTTWFPERERAGAIGFYTSGQFVGLAFLTPVLAWMDVEFGWASVFMATGALGLIWAVIWFLMYRDPVSFRGTNRSEVALITEGGGGVFGAGRQPFSWRDVGVVLGRRKLWGIYIGQFGLNCTAWFFLTWFPTYLVHYRHLSFIKAGFLASVPFFAAFAGVMCSGFLSDLMLRRGASLGFARKVPIITGLLCSTVIIGANYVDSPAAIIAFMTLAFFANGLASITWSLVSSLAPTRLLGLTGGIFNLMGNLAAVVTPIVIGRLATGDSFTRPIMFVAATALIGALSYIFLVGKVERLEG
ncbi:MFS transporter [Lichenicola cladoniae]|uniref:MFS transporter n=1 Tax=Lichenicola cladoniae TaxID=1484109 RepID=A0A6M8HRD1_9PROT|nr:MFS transporter [Lichenicola cladoniae]NPD69072.1 MFS transporter [Acetobacteraceae bacterium]QKE90898.1 MFS transporter [Lichenicola cladoniae]